MQAVKGDTEAVKTFVENPNPKCIYLFGKSYPPDFSITNGGQMFATGLSKAGYFAMSKYVDDNKAARANVGTKAVEKLMLQKIKAQYNIVHNSYDEAEAAKRAGNMHPDAAAAEALPEIPFDYDLF